MAEREDVINERTRRVQDILAYNGLVQLWPEIPRIAAEQRAATPAQGALDIDGGGGGA